MINVLIAEDSPVMQKLLEFTISSDPDFRVVGIVGNGEEAVHAVNRLNPDVVAMDWQMPKLDGKEATRIIMELNPKPIVIVTGSANVKDIHISFSMMEAGALAIVRKPPGPDHPDYQKEAEEFLQTLKLMSQVKMVRRYYCGVHDHQPVQPPIGKIEKAPSDIQSIVMGASTGGPLILQKIISGLPKNFRVPILIVQHMSSGFTAGFVEWLSKTSKFPLHIATHGEFLLPGHGYVAPDDMHMGVIIGGRIMLSGHDAENGLRPSVSYLFRTAAQVYGSHAIGILLSGMGRDGADELKMMREKGAVTIAQNKETSVVHGMPGEAIKLNAAQYILSPDEIISALTTIVYL